MSNYVPDDDTDDPDDQGGREVKVVQIPRSQIRSLEKKAKERDDMAAENTRLTRQLALRDAELKLNPKQLTALERTHDGDWTPEAIKATATELGFFTPEPPPTEELEAHQRMTNASAGALAPSGDVDAQYFAELSKATTTEETMAVVARFKPQLIREQ